MPSSGHSPLVCQVCNKTKTYDELLAAELVSDLLVDIIKKKIPDWSPDGFICLDDLNLLRTDYIRHMLEVERGELSALDEEVMHSMGEQEIMARDINAEFDQTLTFGERLSDKIATFGGSWRFIIIFGSVLAVWITLNSIMLLQKPFDPYPFILLNLVLSCLAAIQAPIIMMSQNRQESKDRIRGEHDYRINLKAELEIRHLQEKLDHYLNHQWQRLLEIQQIQMDLMEQLSRNKQTAKSDHD